MEFKLCGKSYPFKMNLKAMKLFKEKTGGSLWCSLLEVSLAHAEAMPSKDIMKISIAIAQCIDELTAAYIFYVLAKQEDSFLEIEQFEDAVVRLGWLPYEKEDGEFTQPYTLMLVEIAQSIDQQWRDSFVKKKPQTGKDLTTK